MSVTVNTGTDELLCSINQRVATITLNRPEKRNALSDKLTPALRQVLLDLETNNDVGCIVLQARETHSALAVISEEWLTIRTRSLARSRPCRTE